MSKRHCRYGHVIGLISIVLMLFCGCAQPIAAKKDSKTIAGIGEIQSLNIEPTITPVITEIAAVIAAPDVSSETLNIPTPTPVLNSEPVITPEPTPVASSVHLIAVGDDLIHKKVINSGKQEDGSYDYTHLFVNLKQDITNADLAVINQETILGTSNMKYTGYPAFCSPMSVGEAVIDAGFDIVLHATNHSMDRNVAGIQTTLSFWKQHPEITVLGMHDSQESYDSVTYYEKNGIKFALLNYTYGLNGYQLPKDQTYLVDLFDEQHIRTQLKTARREADFVIVFPHWGNEYVYQSNKWQKKWAELFAQEGVDLVIGAHPHVLQPVEWITSPDGHRMLVYYSLGNYVSTMDYTDRMLGGMADVTITKDKEGTYITNAFLTPLVTHYERGKDSRLTVYKLSEYSETLAKKHYIIKDRRGADFSLNRVYELADQIIGQNWLAKKEEKVSQQISRLRGSDEQLHMKASTIN